MKLRVIGIVAAVSISPVVGVETSLAAPGSLGEGELIFEDRILQECDNSKIGNGICNEECLSKEFLFDGGDCCVSAAPGDCTKFKIGNGVCEPECENDETCGFDAADCNNQDELSQCVIDTEFECNISRIGDGFCDKGCQATSCLNDKNDCAIEAEFYAIRAICFTIAIILLLILLIFLCLIFFGDLHQPSHENEININEYDGSFKNENSPKPFENSPGNASGNLQNFIAQPSQRYEPKKALEAKMPGTLRMPARRQQGKDKKTFALNVEEKEDVVQVQPATVEEEKEKEERKAFKKRGKSNMEEMEINGELAEITHVRRTSRTTQLTDDEL